MKKIIPLLLVMQLGYAEDLQEGVTYSYPFFYDDSDAFEDEDEPKQAQSASKKKQASVYEGKMGNADVVIDVGNTDFPSQCHAEWEEIKRRKGVPKEEKKSEDKKESHALNVEFSFKCTTP